MSCPYLTEVTMCFCAGFPVRKLVPSRRVVTDSRCEGEGFGACPVFRELAARRTDAPRRPPLESHPGATQEGGEP